MVEAAAAGEASVRRALAALELAAVRHRAAVRRRLSVGDDELIALLYLAHEGGVPQGCLADVTTLSRSGTGAMVQRLEERRLIQRRADPADRRRRVVELSPLGHERIRAAYGEVDAAVRAVVGERPDSELAALVRLLDDLRRAAEAAAAERPAAPAPSLPRAAGEPIWRRWG